MNWFMDFNKIQVLVEKFDYLLLRVNELQKKKESNINLTDVLLNTVDACLFMNAIIDTYTPYTNELHTWKKACAYKQAVTVFNLKKKKWSKIKLRTGLTWYQRLIWWNSYGNLKMS